MTTNGFIKISRSILEWRWFSDANTFRLFMFLLLTANFADTEYNEIEIKRGECLTTVKKLSQQTKMSIQNIRTSLNRLKLTNEITIRTTPKFSIITINNYDKYQSGNKQTNKQLTNKQQTEASESNKPLFLLNNKEEIYNKKNNNKKARARENTNGLNPKVHNFPERDDIDFEGLMDSIRKRGRRDE